MFRHFFFKLPLGVEPMPRLNCDAVFGLKHYLSFLSKVEDFIKHPCFPALQGKIRARPRFKPSKTRMLILFPAGRNLKPYMPVN